MTHKQEQAIKWLREEIFVNDSNHHDGYEYKQFDVTELDWGNKIQVISDVGLVGDENTLACIFARTRRHILIGPRGGLVLLNTARYSKRQNRMVPAAHATGQRVAWALTS